jgi:hypothetical protein
MSRAPSPSELAVVDASLAEFEKMRRDPESDWHRGPQVERDFLRRRELELLEVKTGERSPDDLTPVLTRDQDARAFAIIRHERPGFWHSGSPEAEALRARERAMIEDES